MSGSYWVELRAVGMGAVRVVYLDSETVVYWAVGLVGWMDCYMVDR